MWDIPGPGIEPTSLALAGGFLTTVPPEKSPSSPLTITPLQLNKIKENPHHSQNLSLFGQRNKVLWGKKGTLSNAVGIGLR